MCCRCGCGWAHTWERERERKWRRVSTMKVNIWGIWVEFILEFSVLFLKLFCKCSIMLKENKINSKCTHCHTEYWKFRYLNLHSTQLFLATANVLHRCFAVLYLLLSFEVWCSPLLFIISLGQMMLSCKHTGIFIFSNHSHTHKCPQRTIVVIN